MLKRVILKKIIESITEQNIVKITFEGKQLGCKMSQFKTFLMSQKFFQQSLIKCDLSMINITGTCKMKSQVTEMSSINFYSPWNIVYVLLSMLFFQNLITADFSSPLSGERHLVAEDIRRSVFYVSLKKVLPSHNKLKLLDDGFF